MRAWLRHGVGWLSPIGFLLVVFCFLLPFAVVACDAPGGFGRAGPGGTTTYTGVDLVTGDEPEVTPERLRPAAERREDRLGPRALAIVAIVLAAAGALAATAISPRRARRLASTVLAAVAAVALAANQATVEALLAARLREQLTVQMPPGREAGDFVRTGNGFWLALTLLGAITAGNAIGLARPRRPAAPPPRHEIPEVPPDRAPTQPLQPD